MGSPKRNSAQASKGTALLTVPLLCCLLFRSVVGFKFKQGSTGSSSSSAVDGVQPVPHFGWGKHYQEVMGLSDLPLHIAGAILPVIVANPLQVVKVQLQSSKALPGRSAIALAHAIFERDGIKGFFRGLLPALVGICPAIFSHGLVYFMLKKLVTGGAWSGERHGDLTELLCGLAAIFAQNIVTNPIGLVQTRMQLGSDPADGGSAGWREVARCILAGEGPRGFYKGLLASCLRCSENLIVFTARGHVDRWLKNRVIPPPAAKDRSLCRNMFEMFEGPIPRSQSVVPYTLIKLVAILATYPFEVVRTRQREQAQKGVSNKYNGLLQSLSLIARDEGLGGLYAGAGTHLARVVAGSSLLGCLKCSPVKATGAPVAGVQPVQRTRWGERYVEVMNPEEMAPYPVTLVVAPILALIVANPLQVVKVQLQSSGAVASPRTSAAAVARTILERQGMKGFFRGLSPALVGICPAILSHGLTYFVLKQIVSRGAWYGERHGDLTELLCGSAAILAQNVVTNPIGVVQTRMQLEGGSAGWREVAQSILAAAGLGGFYKGLLASCLRCSENLIVFVARGRVDRWLKNRLVRQQAHKKKVRRWGLRRKRCEVAVPRSHTRAAYMLARLVGVVATYPFEVVRTKQREQARTGVSNKYTGLLRSLSLISREEGLRGLFAGGGAHFARVAAGPASMACLGWYTFSCMCFPAAVACAGLELAEKLPILLSDVVRAVTLATTGLVFLVPRVVAFLLFVGVSLWPGDCPGPHAWPM